MAERFSELARLAIVLAREEARAFMDREVTAPHLLVGIARPESAVAARALDALDITLERLQFTVARTSGWGAGAPVPEGRFHPEVEQALKQAGQEAQTLGQNEIGTGHILLALTLEEQVGHWQIWSVLGASAETVRDETRRLLADGAEDPPPGPFDAGGITSAAASARASSFGGELAEALDRAKRAARRDGKREIDAGDLLLALATDDSSLAGIALTRAGVDFGSLRRSIAELREVDAELAAIRERKEAALAAHEFELAAELRDKERSVSDRRHGLIAPRATGTGTG